MASCAYRLGDTTGKRYDTYGNVCSNITPTVKYSLIGVGSLLGAALLGLGIFFTIRWRRRRARTSAGLVVPERPAAHWGGPPALTNARHSTIQYKRDRASRIDFARGAYGPYPSMPPGPHPYDVQRSRMGRSASLLLPPGTTGAGSMASRSESSVSSGSEDRAPHQAKGYFDLGPTVTPHDLSTPAVGGAGHRPFVDGVVGSQHGRGHAHSYEAPHMAAPPCQPHPALSHGHTVRRPPPVEDGRRAPSGVQVAATQPTPAASLIAYDREAAGRDRRARDA